MMVGLEATRILQALAVSSPWGAPGQALNVTSFLASTVFLGGALMLESEVGFALGIPEASE